MRNVFFTHGTRNEQFLQQGLVEEYIKMFGMDVLYIPRQPRGRMAYLMKRSSQSLMTLISLKRTWRTLMVQGGGDLRQSSASASRMKQHWSYHSKDSLTPSLVLSKIEVEIGERPQEGDLIWFPLTANYFEIKHVEHEEPFYQLGKNYTYKLKCGSLNTPTNKERSLKGTRNSLIQDTLSNTTILPLAVHLLLVLLALTVALWTSYRNY